MAHFRLFGREKHAIILDLSSASIAAALVRFTPGKEGEIVTSIREEIPFQEDLTYKRFLTTTIDTLRQVLVRLQKQKGFVASPVHCFLASPWFIGETRQVSYSDEKPFKVTEEFITKMTTGEVERFKQKEQKENGGKLKGGAEVVEVKTTSLALNGYVTRSPYGKNAQSVTLSLFISVCSRTVLDAFDQTIVGTLHHDEIYFHTLPPTFIMALADIAVTPERFAFVSVSGEITDLITVEHGAVREILSFPLGMNFVARWLAKRLSVSVGEALDMLELYQDKKLNKLQNELVSKTIDYLKTEWLHGLGDSLSQSPFEYLLPKNLFLLAPPGGVTLFAEFLKSPELTKFIQTNSPFEVTPITGALLGAPHGRDPSLLGETLFLNRLVGV